MQVFDKLLEELTPYENNPRNNAKAVAAVAESIKQFGFKQPVVIDRNGVIVAGHTRVLAAKKLGLKSVPCVVADDLTEEQVNAYRLADNKTNELAEWNFKLLDEELAKIGTIDMSLFGFDPKNPQVADDNWTDADEEMTETKTQEGDLWKLGRHRLYCGDSTDINAVEYLMGGVKADMLLTDPPYGVDYDNKDASLEAVGKRSKSRTYHEIEHDKDKDIRAFLTSAFYAAKCNMVDGGVFHVWSAPGPNSYTFYQALLDAGMSLRQVLIWVKNTPVIGRSDYQWQHEPCLSGESVPDLIVEDYEQALYGWKDGAAHKWYKKRKEKTVLHFDKPLANKLHPTMKPVLLFDYEMQCNTKPGDNVLDLFGGSGTTIVAAEQNGRNAYLMELDPHYCDVIIARWEKLTGEKAVLLNGGKEMENENQGPLQKGRNV